MKEIVIIGSGNLAESLAVAVAAVQSPPLRPGSGLRASPPRAGLRARPCGRENRKQMHVSHQRAF